MNWGFLAICCLYSGSFAYDCVNHGKQRTGSHNALYAIPAIAVHIVLVLWAMHWKL